MNNRLENLITHILYQWACGNKNYTAKQVQKVLKKLSVKCDLRQPDNGNKMEIEYHNEFYIIEI